MVKRTNISFVKKRMKTITEDESEAGGVGKQEQKSMTFLRRAHKTILEKKTN